MFVVSDVVVVAARPACSCLFRLSTYSDSSNTLEHLGDQPGYLGF